jgi:hypothetical protein
VNVTPYLICLSPEWIEISEQVGYYAAAFAIGVTLALIFLSLRQRNFAWLPLYGSLLLLHPAWTMTAVTGDCGFGKRFLSVAASLTMVAILICQIFWPHLSRRRFILSLCLIAWIAFLLDFVKPALPIPDSWRSLDDGLPGQILVPFFAAGPGFSLVAIVLSLVSFVMWLFDRIASRRSSKEANSIKSAEEKKR